MIQPGCHYAKKRLVSRIKRAANRAGHNTCRDLSKASGVSKSGIDKIYNLRSYPCFDTLLAISAACNTTVDKLVSGLQQDASFHGQRSVKVEEETTVKPEKPVPEHRQLKKPRTYKCFTCKKTYESKREVRECYASHKQAKPEVKPAKSANSLMEQLAAMAPK